MGGEEGGMGRRTERGEVPLQRGERYSTFHTLSKDSIGNYFVKGFLANVTDGPGGPALSEGHSQHTSRHAVASMLADMGLTPQQISALTLNSADTLQETYIVAVDRHWPIPFECVNAQPWLSAKVMIPFVHFSTSDKNADGSIVPGTCKCSQLLQGSSNTSVGRL